MEHHPCGTERYLNIQLDKRKPATPNIHRMVCPSAACSQRGHMAEWQHNNRRRQLDKRKRQRGKCYNDYRRLRASSKQLHFKLGSSRPNNTASNPDTNADSNSDTYTNGATNSCTHKCTHRNTNSQTHTNPNYNTNPVTRHH